MKYILIIAALFAATFASAQTKSVLKNINGSTITESLTIGSGKTLTIASGATINATGATITGFTAAAAWGSITGTLSAQTDLQSAFDLKATKALPIFTGQIETDGDIVGQSAGVTRYNDGQLRFFGGASSSPWHGGSGGSLLIYGADSSGQHGGNGGNLNMYGTPGQNAGSITTTAGGSLTMGAANIAGGAVAGTILTTDGNGSSLTGLTPSQLAQASATSGQVLTWSGSAWAPATATGGVTSITGTANQITVTGTTTPTLSLPATITGLTSVTSTTFVGGLTGLASLNLPLAGGTLTGPLINSTNGAVSAAVLSLTGTIYASGTTTTTKPTLLIEPTGTTSTGWSTGGTLMGANAPSGFAGRIIDLQVNGTSKFSVDANGYFSLGSVQMLAFNGTMYIGSASSGNMNMNPGGTSWWQFNTAGNLGGRSDSVLGWASSGTPGTNDLSLGRDAAGVLAQRNSTSPQAYRLYETDSGSNDEYLELSAAASVNTIKPVATGTGTASTVRYYTTTTVWFGSGSGTPEASQTAGIGSVYTDTATGTLYRKTSGTGNTGWVTP